MELVSFGKEVLQSIAEHAASYRLGQAALRHLDRALWVIEKCARWAVPPPLEQDDERPQPELVRPLPWVFFLMMLIALRVTRESISLVNLVLGKPPLRSADVVMFIQSKRRYLRTLKYQGTRKSRARSSQAAAAPSPATSWYTSLYSMFELTMCFRRQSHCDNNNTTPVFTRVVNNDELVVVKRGREDSSPTSPSAPSENTMERLIEKMMVDLDVESDEDSTYTLTNISTSRTDRSDCTLETDQDTVYHNKSTPTSKQNGNASNEDIHFSPNAEKDSSTPEKIKNDLSKDDSINSDAGKDDSIKSDSIKDDSIKSEATKDDTIKSDASKDDSIKSFSSKDDSIKSDASKDDSIKSVSSKDDSIKSNSSKDDSIKSNSSKNDSIKSDATKDDSIKSESSKNYTIKSGSSKDDSIKSDSSKDDSIKSDASNDDSIKSDASKDDSIKAESSKTDSKKENSKVENGTEAHNANIFNTDCETSILTPENQLSDKQVTQNFIQNETKVGMPKKEHKIANGRTVKSVSNKKKGGHRERQQSNEVVQPRALTSNNSF